MAIVSSVVLVVLIVDESVSQVEAAVEVLVADSVLVSVVSMYCRSEYFLQINQRKWFHLLKPH